MGQENERMLIIITGPVGAGKSSTSLALAQALRRPAVAVAAIDLDQVYGFVRQQDGYGDEAAWERARYGAAALANCLFDTGMSVVIIDGEFFNAHELATLTTAIDPQVRRYFFTLQISYATALAHVQGDPSRGASRDPVFLNWLHTNFMQALPFLEAASVVISSDQLSQDAVVARIVAALGDPARP